MRSLIHTAESTANYHASGFWKDETLGDVVRSLARNKSRAPALSDDRTTWSWAEYGGAILELRDALLHLGLRAGDAALLLQGNTVYTPLIRLALAELGAVSVIANPAMGREEIRQSVEETAARSLFIDPAAIGEEGAQAAIEVGREVDAPVYVSGPQNPHGQKTVESLLSFDNHQRAPIASRVGSDTIDEIKYTSGTTGSPKGVMGRQNRWLAMCRNQHSAGRFSQADIGLVISPLGGTVGYLKSTVLAPLIGGHVILMEHTNPSAIWDTIESKRITYLVSVPALTSDLYYALREDDARGKRRDLRTLRLIFNGGAPMPSPLAESLIDRLGCTLLTGIGSTEAGAPAGTRADDDPWVQAHTVGSVYPGSEIGVLVDGTVQTTGQGELVSRGASLFDGYFRDSKRTREAVDENGWFHHGDEVSVNIDGNISYIGRMDGVINRGGVKINPAEVETVLLQHPSVVKVAVLGLPDERLGQRIGAVVVTNDSDSMRDASEVKSFFDRIAAPLRLRPDLAVATESIPLLPTGKIDRQRLVGELNNNPNAYRLR